MVTAERYCTVRVQRPQVNFGQFRTLDISHLNLNFVTMQYQLGLKISLTHQSAQIAKGENLYASTIQHYRTIWARFQEYEYYK